MKMNRKVMGFRLGGKEKLVSCALSTLSLNYLEAVSVSYLIPKIEGQKLESADGRCLLDKIELFNGDMTLSDDQKRELLMILITNVGLRSLVDMLPSQSVADLRDLISHQGIPTGKTAKRTRRVKIELGGIPLSPRKEKLMRDAELILYLLNKKGKK
jgi:hypothetical protein